MIQLIKQILHKYRAPITVVTSVFGLMLEFIIELPFMIALYLSGDLKMGRQRVRDSRKHKSAIH